jgi:hypothetical protein
MIEETLLKEESSKRSIEKEARIPTFDCDENSIDISSYTFQLDQTLESDEGKKKDMRKKRDMTLTMWDYKDLESFQTSHPLSHHQNQFYLLSFGYEMV